MRRTLACLLVMAGIGFGARPCDANPEQVTLQSALVWRTDGSGDYPLQELKPDTTYELPKAISTAGQIQMLTATWTFEGQVTMELSADGGAHYTPVLYGVPLTSGFTRGNRLKWRATLAPESSLSEAKVIYTDGSKVLGSFGDPRLSGFQHRKPIAIMGSTAGTLFHYQLALAIGESAEATGSDAHCQGRVRSDFADIRITTADGQTVLPHYLDRVVGVSPARLAMVWVNIPQLPPEGLTLYLYYGYYGNPTAPDLSDGEAVFDFFEDFKGPSLDPKRWDTHLEGQGGVRVADSRLYLTSASVLSKTFQLTDGMVEYLATTTTAQDDARLIVRSDPKATHPDETNQVAYASAYGGAEHVLAVGSIVKANDPKPIAAGTPYAYHVLARGTTLTFQRHHQDSADAQATVTFDDAGGLTRGVVGLHSDGSASYDWIRARKSAQPAPGVVATVALAPEEAVNLPVFTNALVMPNGNLGLADPKLEGLYETTDLPTDVAVRILIPDWRGQASAMAVSTDGGQSYLRDCIAGVHYYASKGQFAPGKHLRAQMALQGTKDIPRPELQALTFDYTPGTLFIVSPNGGERFIQGSTHQIIWSALGHDATYPVKLEYSLAGGKAYKTIVDSTENDGTYVWVLPDRVTSEEVRVRVSDRNDPSIFDDSDEPFAILSADEAARRQRAQEALHQQAAETEAGDAVDLLEVLDTLPKDANATPQDIAVKVTESGDYKAGDLVLIRPTGTEWSDAEKNSFLIIQADLSPRAIQMLMNPSEVPTGKIGQDGKPLMRQLGKRKFKIDLSFFDLKPRASDRGKPPVRRHFKSKENLHTLLEDRAAEPPSTPAQPVPVNATR